MNTRGIAHYRKYPLYVTAKYGLWKGDARVLMRYTETRAFNRKARPYTRLVVMDEQGKRWTPLLSTVEVLRRREAPGLSSVPSNVIPLRVAPHPGAWVETFSVCRTLKSGAKVRYEYKRWRWLENGVRKMRYIGKVEKAPDVVTARVEKAA